VLSKLAGVVCLSGGLGSHLAIVSREFSIPALMGTILEENKQLHGRRVVIEPRDGDKGVLMIDE
jgi:phosphoenolpyruvate-protein kinase (PTS system EI component)